jgi:hypothetical protein
VSLNLIANNVNKTAVGPAAAVTPAGPTGPAAPSQGGTTSLPQPVPAEPGIPARNPSPSK